VHIVGELAPLIRDHLRQTVGGKACPGPSRQRWRSRSGTWWRASGSWSWPGRRSAHMTTAAHAEASSSFSVCGTWHAPTAL